MTLAALAKILTGIDLVLAALLSVVVISRRREPAATLAWVLAFFFLPLIGILLYSFFGYQHFRLRRRRTPNPTGRLALIHAQRVAVAPALQSVENLTFQLTAYPATAGNRVEIFTQAQDTDAALGQAIRKARHHVHMCYYIFTPDSDGIFYRDLLAQQAERGVEVRLLLDGVGSAGVSNEFLEPLVRAGGKVTFFSPFRRFRRPWGFNFRNHRKLSIVDGKLAFVGSQNIGRNIWRRGTSRRLWRETDVGLEGPVVEELQTVFAEDWDFSAGENLSGSAYFIGPEEIGNTVVQALPTGPDGRANVLAFTFLQAVHAAQKRVTVTTPYFIPTQPVALALQAAARRGVRVEILVPRDSDHPVVSWAGRSWYEELIDSGVYIHEYEETFLHSKVVTIDEKFALLGSANMDARSFLINFELSLLFYDEGVAGSLVREFEKRIADKPPLSKQDMAAKSALRNLGESLCRVLSPVL